VIVKKHKAVKKPLNVVRRTSKGYVAIKRILGIE